jgi:signal transduction histidine kinase
MQAEIEQSDGRFRRSLNLINLGWMVVSLLTLTFSAVGTFRDYPQYLRDWHGLAIFLLMFLIMGLFARAMLSGCRKKPGTRHWPPPLFSSLCYWLGMYIPVTLLSSIDSNFIWAYFIALGITFSMFTPRLMIALVALIFFTYAWFSGLLSWPMTSGQTNGLLGNGISFLSLAIVCITIQHLISERSERGRLLQQIAHTNHELEAAQLQLAGNSIQEQELAVLRERTRLAREMHDTLGHALVLVSVKLEAAQRLRERDPQRCEQELESTKEIVRYSMQELRASIANLRSPALEREPACRALSRCAREMALRTGLRVSYDLHPEIEGLPEPIEETLWKVGQEALTNIEKHAHAQNVLLHISRQNSQIFLRIEDDGVGIPPDLCQRGTGYQSPEGHYGLNGMLERVKNMHGQLFIHPPKTPGVGTTIEMSLPLVEAPLLAV